MSQSTDVIAWLLHIQTEDYGNINVNVINVHTVKDDKLAGVKTSIPCSLRRSTIWLVRETAKPACLKTREHSLITKQTNTNAHTQKKSSQTARSGFTLYFIWVLWRMTSMSMTSLFFSSLCTRHNSLLVSILSKNHLRHKNRHWTRDNSDTLITASNKFFACSRVKIGSNLKNVDKNIK